ncbi:MAG: kynureninase [Planctomycetaceae bacterium]|jgi:kynureninase|nr:kynureninase [Planctomycetaceae bacterium]
MATLTAAAFSHDRDFARSLDARDELSAFRAAFVLPEGAAAFDGGEPIYFVGNSLGPMPVAARTLVNEELDDWSRLGVKGHLGSRRPWYSYHEQLRAPLARLVGAREHEVVAMGSLTENIHRMLTTFYRPAGKRTKLLIEKGAFPSDTYAVMSHVAARDLDPSLEVVEIAPRAGEWTLREDDIDAEIARLGDTLALALLPGVQYRTGQALDLARHTRAVHAVGARCGWDLAHAVGNLAVSLHDSNADFAVWCSYKYLNSGPGAVAGAFIHERNAGDLSLPRHAGWWGNDPATRFRMEPRFVPVPRADAWSLSNPPILAVAPLIASLAAFDGAGIAALRAKSVRMTALLEFLLRDLAPEVEIITPAASHARGAQLSLLVAHEAHARYEAFKAAGLACDYRESGRGVAGEGIVRLAPAPLFNTFDEVWRAAQVVRRTVRG